MKSFKAHYEMEKEERSLSVGNEGGRAERGGGVGRACQWFLISAADVGLMLTYIQKQHDNKK